jgi:hypothetical protein
MPSHPGPDPRLLARQEPDPGVSLLDRLLGRGRLSEESSLDRAIESGVHSLFQTMGGFGRFVGRRLPDDFEPVTQADTLRALIGRNVPVHQRGSVGSFRDMVTRSTLARHNALGLARPFPATILLESPETIRDAGLDPRYVLSHEFGHIADFQSLFGPERTQDLVQSAGGRQYFADRFSDAFDLVQAGAQEGFIPPVNTSDIQIEIAKEILDLPFFQDHPRREELLRTLEGFDSLRDMMIKGMVDRFLSEGGN